MKLSLIALMLSMGLMACATEQKQPNKEWNVKVTTSGEAKIWVAKADGSRQCEPNSAILTTESATSELRKAGVIVHQSREGNDGMMHTAVCGSATGNTIEVEISRVDIAKAQSAGYRPMKASK